MDTLDITGNTQTTKKDEVYTTYEYENEDEIEIEKEKIKEEKTKLSFWELLLKLLNRNSW